MLKNSQKWLSAALLCMLAAGSIGTAVAGEGTWARTHPRRAEVNGRLANQNHRIRQEVREGEMSRQQAAKLHREDRQIRREERMMARQNGGHITKPEQRVLNQQENAVSRQIGH